MKTYLDGSSGKNSESYLASSYEIEPITDYKEPDNSWRIPELDHSQYFVYDEQYENGWNYEDTVNPAEITQIKYKKKEPITGKEALNSFYNDIKSKNWEKIKDNLTK